MNFQVFNEEVLFTSDSITRVNGKDIELLKQKAAVNPRKRVRLCAHGSPEDSVHEMLIVHSKGAYVRPHKHLIASGSPDALNKSESFHIIEGALKVVIFDDSGCVIDVIDMGDYRTGKSFYQRISNAYFHTVIPTSEMVVFHETTKGPFRREDTVFAPWSPEENDVEGQAYVSLLDRQISDYEDAGSLT